MLPHVHFRVTDSYKKIKKLCPVPYILRKEKYLIYMNLKEVSNIWFMKFWIPFSYAFYIVILLRLDTLLKNFYERNCKYGSVRNSQYKCRLSSIIVSYDAVTSNYIGGAEQRLQECP